MGRLVGIDYGKKRIGIAQSDPMKMIASPLTTIQAGKKPEETVAAIIAATSDVEYFVVGLPLHLDGTESEMSGDARRFAELLSTLSGKEVKLLDERLSSKQVERVLMETKMSRKKRSQHVDTMAAALILQTHLDSNP